MSTKITLTYEQNDAHPFKIPLCLDNDSDLYCSHDFYSWSYDPDMGPFGTYYVQTHDCDSNDCQTIEAIYLDS